MYLVNNVEKRVPVMGILFVLYHYLYHSISNNYQHRYFILQEYVFKSVLNTYSYTLKVRTLQTILAIYT